MTQDFKLHRVRTETNGSETGFREAIFDGRFPYRAEVAFPTLEELSALHRDGRLIGVRMQEAGDVGNRRPQVNLVGVRHIDGL